MNSEPMKKDLINFIEKNNLNPFNQSKTNLKLDDSIFKTRDAKSIQTKTLSHISSNFFFKETSNLLNFFGFTKNEREIILRQEFFKSLELNNQKEKQFLRNLKKPRVTWKPRYEIVAVTEDESTFIKLKELGCSVEFLVSDSDISNLERYDIIQVIDCDNFKILLERIPGTVFINSIDDVYLERYLETLSSWTDNFGLLRKEETSNDLNEVLEELKPLFSLISGRENKIMTAEEVEKNLENINEKISQRIKEMTISGDILLKILGEGKMPLEILQVVRDAIEESKISESIFNLTLPVSIDYKELEEQIKRQSANEFTNVAEDIKRNAEKIKRIPLLLKRLSSLILFEDFTNGIFKFVTKDSVYPSISKNFHLSNAKNILLSNPSPISFQLDSFSRCSILTGANSGGKTTLLEHIIQNITLFFLGLPIPGTVHLPIFTDVYYFAKNKGSASKGAFETLLSQMSNIKFGPSTLILADEIEAVTEPGIAGKIISATADYFIKKNCFIVLATHLGHEIKKSLPQGARIDGIEAKGLDENFNLIVDHNPVMGRLAHSTPELIVERMASLKGLIGEEYFKYLNNYLKSY